MLQQGYHSVQIWCDPTEYRQIREAARAARLAVSTFCRRVAFAAALRGDKPDRI